MRPWSADLGRALAMVLPDGREAPTWLTADQPLQVITGGRRPPVRGAGTMRSCPHG